MATTNTKKAKAAGPAERSLRVSCKRESFRRAGIDWADTKIVPMSELTPEQVELLQNEPMLVVDEIDTPAAA